MVQKFVHALARYGRGIIGMALVLAFSASLLTPALADTTSGNLSGVITSSDGKPVVGITVTAISPTQRAVAHTDAKGFYSLIGLPPDTYTVTISGNTAFAEDVVNGVTISANQTFTLDQKLAAHLKTIGGVTTRGSAGISAFQPQQPVDTYTVNSTQIETALGKAHAVSETNLIVSLPGASLDSSGYPVLRGGRENDEGIQFEGIDYVDAFSNQFVNSLALNGLGAFQLTPGAGDASLGNAGTGALNGTAKRGTYPAFGSVEADARGPYADSDLDLEYGFASANGHFSSYTSFQGEDTTTGIGRPGSNAAALGFPVSTVYEPGRDLIENLVFKFGKDNSQSLQFVYQNQLFKFESATNFATPNFNFGGPQYNAAFDPAFNGVSPLVFGQTAETEQLNRAPSLVTQPNATLKLQYTNAINSSTFLTAKIYRVDSTAVFDEPYASSTYLFNDGYGGGGITGDIYANQGGIRTGATIDLTKQLGSRNLVSIGAKHDYLVPDFSEDSAGLGLVGASGLFGTAPFLNDFIPAGAGLNGQGTGYLSSFFPNGVPRAPVFNETAPITRQDYSYYITDQFQASDKLKFTVGLRDDTTTYNYPSVASGLYNPGVDPNAFANPSVLEPRAAFAYQFDARDSITSSFGRSTQLPSLGLVTDIIPASNFAKFANIPANPADGLNSCGVSGTALCSSYAQQLLWTYQNLLAGTPIQPGLPATFDNYDASFQHDFGNGLAVKLTPFYRRGYAGLVQSSSPNGQFVNGVPQFAPPVTSNLGTTRTTGAEFYLTKTAAYGWSGSLSLTYLNEFSNVVPLSGSEDFFPQIDTASLALGNQYRVGFISPINGVLAAAYKFHSGWRINPIVGFNGGYPYGQGNLNATEVNGGFFNVTQTNISNPNGSTVATNYVDPANPGTAFNPNIAATRGTPEKAAAGGNLTVPRVNIADLTIEYTKPGTRNTVGVQIANFFNQQFSQPFLNSQYQPVAKGIGGPQSGTSANTPFFSNLGYSNVPIAFGGNQPYILEPSGTPTSYRFYYQLSL